MTDQVSSAIDQPTLLAASSLPGRHQADISSAQAVVSARSKAIFASEAFKPSNDFFTNLQWYLNLISPHQPESSLYH